MDYWRRLRQIDNIPRDRHLVKDRTNPLEELNDTQFHEKFRFSKETVVDIYHMISTDLDITSKRGIPLPPMLQLLICLRFFACGSFQSVTGDLFNVSQPSVSRVVKRVARAIASLRNRYIKFPGRQELPQVMYKFSQIGGIPGVIGSIDCTHVKITCPGGPNAELYRNRKGYFSINVQAVCSQDLKFTNIVARWPGSVHDSRIFQNSRLCARLENNEYDGILLGDSG